MKNLSSITKLGGVLATASAACLLTCGTVTAKDLFVISVDNNIVPPASDESLPDLMKDVIRAPGGFVGVAGQPFTARLNYGGVPNTLIMNANATRTDVTLASALTGLSRRFVGASPEDVENQIEDYFTEDASEELGDLYDEINKRSLVAVTDGTPHSTTALMANRWFDDFGMTIGLTRQEKESTERFRGTFGLSLVPDVSWIDAGEYEGFGVSLPIGFNFQLSERVGLALNVPLNWTSIEDSDFFQAGLLFGLPITIARANRDNPWNWQLTPLVGAMAAGSYDFAAGGIVGGAGLANSISHDFKYFTLTMGNQITAHEGWESDDFDTGVSQQILKNGLKISIPIGMRWLFEIRGAYSLFLQDAAVDDYWTVGGDFVYRLTGDAPADARRGYLFFGAYADLADDYTSPHIRIGSGWKF